MRVSTSCFHTAERLRRRLSLWSTVRFSLAASPTFRGPRSSLAERRGTRERFFAAVQQAFFGPMRVSVMMDSNGSNTTAAAAVLRARRHVPLAGSVAVVLGATGPVGQRAAELLALEGAHVRVGSRSVERAAETCEVIAGRVDGDLSPVATADPGGVSTALEGASTVIAAGATGVQLISAEMLKAATDLEVAIDLNAVPPLGIEGVEMTDKAVETDGVVRYGAIGVGGTKMKIHTAALKRLFDANDGVLDTEAIYRIGESLEGPERSGGSQRRGRRIHLAANGCFHYIRGPLESLLPSPSDFLP
ncbi:MAG: hypothetical protein CM1200mP2_29750 [Planctomycetaceae bacterium]|nr:MAG: hypothetical protein CM1200mP2_29750 [Planctomycetaceae bacterium]